MAGLLRRLVGSVWVRALVSAGLLVVVFLQIDLSAAADRLSGGRWGLFAAAVAALLGSFIVGALRWHLYLEAAQVRSDVKSTIWAYLIGVFTNNFLPSQVGGDVARAWVASGPGTRLRTATTVVVDRVTAIASLIAVGWIAYAARPAAVPRELVVALAASSGALTAAGAAVAVALGSGWLARVGPRRARGPAKEIREAAAACMGVPVLRTTVPAGLAFQGLVVLAAWLVARSLDLDLAFPALAVTLAPVLIVTALPISIGGFGVREGSYVVLLGYAGLGATDATVFSLLAAAAFALASLPGALALLLGGTRPVSSAGAGSGSRAGRT